MTAFHNDTSVQSAAQEDYVPENPGFIAYNNDLSFAARRSDSNVISFEAIFYAYSGGAHGNYGTVGLNYDTRTGEHIRFAELGEDADSFLADTFAFNRALADSAPYQRQMYDLSDDFPSDEQLESVLYAGDKWFLSPSGLVFISNPYELGPYSAGAIEFTIPYHELNKMGFKKDYQYNGNLTVELQEEIPVSMDLNGDGKAETDDTVEIVFMTASGDHEEGEIPAFTSHLFRCEKDGLTYIGRMDDTVSVLGTL